MTFTGRRILLGILLLIVAFCVGLVPSVRAQASNTNVATESGRTASGQAFDVKAAVDAGSKAASKVGELVSSHILARPHDDLLKSFLGDINKTPK